MSTSANPTLPPIRRIRHRQGERLLASDPNADRAYEAMLHRLHLRGLHDTWGVAIGLRLVRGNDRKAVLVTPGLAYDCLGQELLMADGFALQVPTRPANNTDDALAYDLTVRCVDAVKDGASSDGADFCPPPPNPGLALRWVLAGPASTPASELLAKGIRLGEEVPLGRFILGSDDRLSPPDYRFRRIARPQLRPHLAFNSVQPVWQAKYSATFTADIGTAEGGFSQNPHFFVRLVPSDSLASLLAGGKVLGPLTSVSTPNPSGFSVRVSFGLLIADLGEKDEQSLLGDINDGMTSTRLLWFGAESVAGCTPYLSKIFFGNPGLLTMVQRQSITPMAYFEM